MDEDVFCLNCQRKLTGQDGIIALDDEDTFCSIDCLLENLEDYHGLEQITVDDYLRKFN